MSMYTRCPQCETVFRVTPQQLQASSGQVRCGKCQEVFDAFAALSAQLPAPEPRPVASVASPRPVAAAEGLPARRPASAAAGPPSAERVAAPQADPLALGEPVTLTLPDELFGAPLARAAGRGLWAGASLLLVLALAGQAIWFFPGELLARLPVADPQVRTFCAWTGCRVALPRLPDQLFIEASDLQMLDPARQSEVLLTATIRNRAPLAQAFPLLELTLTSPLNEATARKVFGPEVYLAPGVDQARGLGANQEVSLRLYLDTGAVKPAGYRLYLFFG
jgi:predicted Zn finger-like uncharacterized protein